MYQYVWKNPPEYKELKLREPHMTGYAFSSEALTSFFFSLPYFLFPNKMYEKLNSSC